MTTWKKVTDDRHAGPSLRRDELHRDQHQPRDHFHPRGSDRRDRVVLFPPAAAPRRRGSDGPLPQGRRGGRSQPAGAACPAGRTDRQDRRGGAAEAGRRMTARRYGGQMATADTDSLARGSLRLYLNPLRQAVSASTWRATWYLLAYLVVGWVLFGAVLTAGIAAITLAITLAGLPLLIAAAAVIRGCASAERWRLATVFPRRGRGRNPDRRGVGVMAPGRTTWAAPAVSRGLAYLRGVFP